MQNRTVLVVDDDDDLRSLMVEMLRAEGYDVVSASDGSSALDRLAEHPQAAVIVLDLTMPGMDGYEFLRRKRADPKIASIPVVVVTAVTEKPQFVDDVFAFLKKPVEGGVLLAVVDTASSGGMGPRPRG